MAIDIRFNRLVVLKSSVDLYSNEPADVVARHLWQMYTEDEHLMGSSSMGQEVYNVSERLQGFGLERGRDMTIITIDEHSTGVPWLEIGQIDNTVVCWRSGFNPRPIVRHCFVSSEKPADDIWIEELKKFGIQTEKGHDEEGAPIFRCLRGEADVTLYVTKADDHDPAERLVSDTPSLERRALRRLDFDLMGDIQFGLWKTSNVLS